ncbi:FAD binding domain-containing protein [Neofusicoccum parvum]|nr:FAD binding domain-containing protein [Neofusicoccum parvum]
MSTNAMRHPSGPDGTAPPNSSGIKVIVVGLGLGGLAAAIECHRKGHTVIAYDRVPELKPIGDSIGISTNAARVVARWGGGSVDRTLQPLVNYPTGLNVNNAAGELLVRSPLNAYTPSASGGAGGYPSHRGDLATTFLAHAISLGIDVRLGHHITSYFEDASSAGVIVDGQRVAADVVIGADGVHSAARGPITGQDPAPQPSGYAMFRAWFDGTACKADEDASWIFDGTNEREDASEVFIGQDCHVMVGTGKGGKDVFWMCTHKDDRGVGESWSQPADIEEMLEYIKDWPVRAKIEPIVRMTPKDKVIDFQLLWRDPLERWVSEGGRMMLIGDAAHPFLPTSGQGAGQAIEDAAVLAIALELAGKENVRLALRATEKIRYQRATIIQRSGIETRDAWHKTDWEAAAKDPSLVAMPRPKWIYGHDCQSHTYEEFENVVEALKSGKEYIPKNIPAEGTYTRSHDFEG